MDVKTPEVDASIPEVSAPGASLLGVDAPDTGIPSPTKLPGVDVAADLPEAQLPDLSAGAPDSKLPDVKMPDASADLPDAKIPGVTGELPSASVPAVDASVGVLPLMASTHACKYHIRHSSAFASLWK